MEFGTIWGRILESFWRNLDLEDPSVPALRVFTDFWSILGSNLEAFGSLGAFVWSLEEHLGQK